MSARLLIDTHVHFLVDKSAQPNIDEIRERTAYAHRRGLSALCLMEHIDALHYQSLIQDVFIDNNLQWQHQADGVMRSTEGITIFSGAEVSLRDGSDVGVHASPESLLRLNTRKGHYSLAALRQSLESTNRAFLLIAHHVLSSGKWSSELAERPHLSDALEVPGKDPAKSAAYLELARNWTLPVVCGSDAHVWPQIGIGCARISTDLSDCHDPRNALFSAVRSGAAEPTLAPDGTTLLEKARKLRASLAAAANN